MNSILLRYIYLWAMTSIKPKVCLVDPKYVKQERMIYESNITPSERSFHVSLLLRHGQWGGPEPKRRMDEENVHHIEAQANCGWSEMGCIHGSGQGQIQVDGVLTQDVAKCERRKEETWVVYKKKHPTNVTHLPSTSRRETGSNLVSKCRTVLLVPSKFRYPSECVYIISR